MPQDLICEECGNPVLAREAVIRGGLSSLMPEWGQRAWHKGCWENRSTSKESSMDLMFESLTKQAEAPKRRNRPFQNLSGGYLINGVVFDLPRNPDTGKMDTAVCHECGASMGEKEAPGHAETHRSMPVAASLNGLASVTDEDIATAEALLTQAAHAAPTDHEAKPEWDTATAHDLCEVCEWPVSKGKDGKWTHDAKNPTEWTDKRTSARTGPTIDDPEGYDYQPAPDWVARACRRRFEGGGATAMDPKRPGHYLHGVGNWWDGPSEITDNGDGTLSYTNPYNGETDRFDERGYYDRQGQHKTWGSAYGSHQSMRKGAPFAGYDDFDACVKANSDKDDPEAYCGKIKHQVEDNKEAAREIRLTASDAAAAHREITAWFDRQSGYGDQRDYDQGETIPCPNGHEAHYLYGEKRWYCSTCGWMGPQKQGVQVVSCRKCHAGKDPSGGRCDYCDGQGSLDQTLAMVKAADGWDQGLTAEAFKRTAGESRGVSGTCPVCYRENLRLSSGKIPPHKDTTREGSPQCEGSGKTASLKQAVSLQEMQPHLGQTVDLLLSDWKQVRGKFAGIAPYDDEAILLEPIINAHGALGAPQAIHLDDIRQVAAVSPLDRSQSPSGPMGGVDILDRNYDPWGWRAANQQHEAVNEDAYGADRYQRTPHPQRGPWVTDMTDPQARADADTLAQGRAGAPWSNPVTHPSEMQTTKKSLLDRAAERLFGRTAAPVGQGNPYGSGNPYRQDNLRQTGPADPVVRDTQERQVPGTDPRTTRPRTRPRNRQQPGQPIRSEPQQPGAQPFGETGQQPVQQPLNEAAAPVRRAVLDKVREIEHGVLRTNTGMSRHAAAVVASQAVREYPAVLGQATARAVGPTALAQVLDDYLASLER